METKSNLVLVMVVLLVTILFVRDASALFIPESSYMDGAWEGVLNYVDEDSGFDVWVVYSVFDAEHLEFQSQEEAFVGDLQDELGLDGQYIYAYQLFNRPNEGEDEYSDILYFGLLDLDTNPVDESLINGDTSAMDDHDGGVAPYSPPPRQGAWGFNEGVLANGERSWILVFSSEYAPIVGSGFISNGSIGGVTGSLPSPGIPEPSTLLLLGFGTVILKRKR